MRNRVKRFIARLCLGICILAFSLDGYSVSADDALVVRSSDNYGIDFTSMSFADYCLFFVQDINLKYGKGSGCVGNGRSDDILGYSSLQDICLDELSGGDNGLDCSALVYIIGKYFGSKCTASSTGAWESMKEGVNIKCKINALSNGFGSLQTGDVIITKQGSQGHALVCVGKIDGQMSMIHIGSSYLCTGSGCDKGCSCCSINPGSGVTFCSSCKSNVTTGSGQNKRFIRTAGVDAYFKSVGSLDSCYIYRPIYDRELGGDYSGTDYGSGANINTITTWVHKTGSLKEEAEIVGMPGKFVFDGEPISIVGRDGLGMSERNNVSTIGTNIGFGRLSISSLSSIIVSMVGLVLIVYAFLIILGYVFDVSNNFIDVSMLSILSFGRWQVVDEPDIKKTVKKNGKVFITKTGVVIRAIIVGLIGVGCVSGLILNCIAWILDKLYG